MTGVREDHAELSFGGSRCILAAGLIEVVVVLPISISISLKRNLWNLGIVGPEFVSERELHLHLPLTLIVCY